MRIISGYLKGRQIHVPKTAELRPTTGRAKEGLFSTIGSRKFLENARVLDLFAGTGNLGFEAISRGAESVVFVDRQQHLLNKIEQRADEFEVRERIRTHCTEVEHFLQGPATPYDFIFCDPPYKYSSFEQIIDPILENEWLAEGGWFILEHNKFNIFETHPNCFISKTYGRVYFTIFTNHEIEEEDKIID